MQTAVTIIGGLVLLAALIGFFHSFWRPTPKRERDEDLPRNFPPGGLGRNVDDSFHSADGGHGGDGGSH